MRLRFHNELHTDMLLEEIEIAICWAENNNQLGKAKLLNLIRDEVEKFDLLSYADRAFEKLSPAPRHWHSYDTSSWWECNSFTCRNETKLNHPSRDVPIYGRSEMERIMCGEPIDNVLPIEKAYE
mgnify:CR=1 FL=1